MSLLRRCVSPPPQDHRSHRAQLLHNECVNHHLYYCVAMTFAIAITITSTCSAILVLAEAKPKAVAVRSCQRRRRRCVFVGGVVAVAAAVAVVVVVAATVHSRHLSCVNHASGTTLQVCNGSFAKRKEHPFACAT